MATKRTADVDTPINFMQEMVTALSGRTRPGVFRPFEREGLVGLIQTGEFQMARMAQITASLSDPDVRRAMLEVLWARQGWVVLPGRPRPRPWLHLREITAG